MLIKLTGSLKTCICMLNIENKIFLETNSKNIFNNIIFSWKLILPIFYHVKTGYFYIFVVPNVSHLQFTVGAPFWSVSFIKVPKSVTLLV